ncbi:Amidohydrolase family, putative [Verrucomicrobiia bacterium DG1235]|nr:Amidohydrolase family, putative [Verrucomicrobiae bacterium DG1235]
MNTYIRCDGYFSERSHHGPFWILIREGKIAEIRQSPPEDDSDSSLVDFPDGAYLLPLLADTHAHVYMNPWPLAPSERLHPGSQSFEIEVDDATERLGRALAKGIGFVRDMGDPLGINTAVKHRALNNPNRFPAYHIPGPAIHRPSKYGRFLGVMRKTMPEVHSLIDELVEKQNIDFIKVVSTGIVDFANRRVKQLPQFTRPELREVVDHAESIGLKVASHCSGEDGIDNNIEGGIHFIEHAYFIRPDQRQKLLDQSQYWTPTFAPVYQQAVNQACGWDARTRSSLYQILSDHNQAIAEGHAQGMKILAGTDAGSPGVDIGDGLIVELQSLALSIPFEEVLRIATAVNADACSHSQYTGRIAVGHSASFALYSRAPWQEPSQLGQPREVYQHGQLVHDTSA